MNSPIISSTLSSILNNIPIGIYILNSELQVMFINHTAKEILGFKKHDNSMLSAHCHDFSAGMICGYSGSLCETLRSGKEVNSCTTQIKNNLKETKTITHTSKLLRNSEGEIIGAYAVIQDVTDEHYQLSIEKEKGFHHIIGQSPKMLRVFESIQQVNKTNATVLILGETGTGKELVASALHETSSRKNGPFIKVNCSALSENILESELFGHVKGSFTGAIRNKIGKFELAQKGTIFLDEIGELNPDIQIKLLRVLQEKEIERVGDNRTIKIDTRIIAATNRNLRLAVQNGSFREDLYYRINVYPIRIPPLRERYSDIGMLVEHFVQKATDLHNKNIQIDDNIIEILKRYNWPGNVRELEHVIQYAIIRSKNNKIEFEDLPEDLLDTFQSIAPKDENDGFPKKLLEKDIVKDALINAGWNKSKASKTLGIGRTTLWRLMKKLDVKDPSHT